MTRNGKVNFVISTLILVIGAPFCLFGMGIRIAEAALIDGYNWMDDFLP
jgi:hypothetical protein